MDEAVLARYEPPTLQMIGSLQEMTLQNKTHPLASDSLFGGVFIVGSGPAFGGGIPPLDKHR